MKKIFYFAVTIVTLSLFLSSVSAQEQWTHGHERYAFVPSEIENNLMIVDLQTEEDVITLPTGKQPHALAFTSNGKCYVNNRSSGDLTVIDAYNFEVITTIPLPGISFQLALSPDESMLAVAYKNKLQITLIDTSTDTIIETIPIGVDSTSFTGPRMKHAYWSEDGRFVYGSDAVNSTLVKVDPLSYSVAAVINLPTPNHYVHPAPQKNLLYAVGETNRLTYGTSVTIIDAETDQIIKDIPIPLQTGEVGLGHHGVFTKNGKYFFLCNEGGRTISIIDTDSLEVVNTILVGMGAGHPMMTTDGKYMYIIHHKDNIVSVIDVKDQAVVNNILIGTGKKQAHGAYITPDNKYLYMVNSEDDMLVKIDLDKEEVISKTPVGRLALFMGMREGFKFPPTE